MTKLLPALIAAVLMIFDGHVAAQTFVNLHSFSDNPSATNSDGAYPAAPLLLSGTTLYGTASGGGISGHGVVFAISTNGGAFTNLHSFAPGRLNASSDFTNSDGISPIAGLVLSGNTLFGTAAAGGLSGNGTVFALNIDGTGFTNLHSFTALSGSLFTNYDGVNPDAALILSGTALYGTTVYGGSSDNGAIFTLNTDGTGFTNLHSFSSGSGGMNPETRLLSLGDSLFGTSQGGGGSANLSVFRINTNGTGFGSAGF